MASKSTHPDWLAKEAQLPKDLHPMFYKLKSDQKLYQVCEASFSSFRFETKLNLKKIIFQKADGIPIHLKRGARDKVLLYLTCAGVAVGLFQSAKFVYSLP